MNSIHEPDSRFLEHLEWQLVSAGRRRSSFGEPSDNLRKRRNVKMIGIILCSVLTGVVAMATTNHLQDMSQGRLSLAQAKIELQLADSRLERSRKNLNDLKERIALGIVSGEEESRAEVILAQLETEKRRHELDYEEVLASHKQPRNELSAPLVNGRDFVTERLKLNVEAWVKTREESRAEAEKMRRLADSGHVQTEKHQSADEAVEQLQHKINGLKEKIELRAAFLRGEIPAAKVDLMALAAEAEQKIGRHDTIIGVIRDEYASTEKRHQLGIASTHELDRARYRLEWAEANLKLARLELEIIQANLNK